MLADLSPEAYREATQHLAALDPDWSRHIAAIGPCLHQATPGREPYEALVRAIAYQQLHARAAEAILGRLLALFPADDFPQPEQLLAVFVGVPHAIQASRYRSGFRRRPGNPAQWL